MTAPRTARDGGWLVLVQRGPHISGNEGGLPNMAQHTARPVMTADVYSAICELTPEEWVRIRKMVAKGAAFLDDLEDTEPYDEWRVRLRIVVAERKLDLRSPFRCVIGTLAGEYTTGISDLGVSEKRSEHHGFNLLHNSGWTSMEAAWVLLNFEWEIEILYGKPTHA